MTRYILESGGSVPSAAAYAEFEPFGMNDAAHDFARLVTDLSANADCPAAWVRLRRAPDAIYTDGLDLIAWTKP